MFPGLPAPRPIDPILEGSYTTAEVAASIANDESINDMLPALEWHLSTMATCADLTASQAAIGAELIAAARRVAELAQALTPAT
jgi:hypothetical protein